MKWILLLLLMVPAGLWGQSSTISTTGVVDTDGFTWSNGSYSVSFVPNPSWPSTSSYQWSGGNLQPNLLFTGTLNGSGVFSQSGIPSSNAITPSGSQWQITVCPNATTGCFSVITPINGTTQDVTALLNASAQGPRFLASENMYGYGTVEVKTQPKQGYIFFNTTNSSCQQWGLAGWQFCGTGAGATSAQGTAPIEVNGVSGAPQVGALTISCANNDCGAGFQMGYTPPGTGQHVLVPSTTVSCSTVTSDWTCDFSGFVLPSYVNPANVTAVYAVAVSSSSVNGREIESFYATGSGTWPSGVFNLRPAGSPNVWTLQQTSTQAIVLPTNYAAVDIHWEICCGGLGTITVSASWLDIYYTGTAPPASNDYTLLAPLNINTQTRAISLYSPFNAGFDFGAVNVYQVIEPLLVNGPNLGDEMEFVPGTTSTSTTPTVAVTNGADTGAHTITNQDGSALVSGQLVAGVPYLLHYDGSLWRIVGSYPGGGSGLSGMTAGQVPIAATATTVTSSKALAGSGTGISTGPTTTTTNDCVKFADASGTLADAGAACGSGSGAVSSVSNSDGSLTISPTTGAVVASLNPGHPNSWTANQTNSGSWSTTSGLYANATGTATSTTNYNSAVMGWTGSAWTGSAAVSDIWNALDNLGTGANPTSLLAITHPSGTTGFTAVQVPQLILSGAGGAATAPLCQNGTSGALTTSGCAAGGSGTVNSGSGYAIPAYGSAASTTIGPSNVTTDSTLNNLIVPGTGTFGAGSSTHYVTIPGGTDPGGSASSATISADTSGNLYNNRLATARVQVCDNGTTCSPVSLLASGITDGKAPVTVTTGSTATLGGTYKSGYTFNEETTAATAVTYTLPTAAAGLQYCVANAYNGSAANTGALTLQTSASGQYIIGTSGTLSASGGYIVSSGAARDSSCVVGVDATHWLFYPSSGTWTLH